MYNYVHKRKEVRVGLISIKAHPRSISEGNDVDGVRRKYDVTVNAATSRGYLLIAISVIK